MFSAISDDKGVIFFSWSGFPMPCQSACRTIHSKVNWLSFCFICGFYDQFYDTSDGLLATALFKITPEREELVQLVENILQQSVVDF